MCPVVICFSLWNGGLRSNPPAFSLLVIHASFGAALWREHSYLSSSHWKKFVVLGLNGIPGRAVVLNCHGAASFGFQILILKQIPFDSSSTQQIPSCVNCRIRSTRTILELSVFAIESLSRVLLWNQGSKCSSVRPFEPLGCVC